MSNVVDALLQDHSNMAKLLDAVERQLAAFERGEPLDLDILQGALDYCLNYPDLYHHPKEDLVWERLRLRDPEGTAAFADLHEEHRKLGELTRRFAAAMRSVLRDLEVSRESVDQIARQFLDRYRRHMEMEEQRFFPAAVRTLTAADWAEIDMQLADRDDPLFGAASEARFKALRQDILTWAAEGA